ncbi:MAG: ankyrin repeat domain-containing protein [Betaproteobacteria bacterium]|nr:ankyrin repeat domain-containing protein [Betaproteobacteria bacterium]
MARDKDDLLGKIRFREWALMTLIAISAVLANLPRAYTEEVLGINHGVLVAVLGCAVIVSLFLYLRFFLFLAVVLLTAGANMPEQIAEGLHISKVPLVLALVAMVGISLINSVVRMLPTGLEPKPKEKSPEGVRAMFYAIEKSNVDYARKVLAMNFDPNLHHDNGYTPLAYAAIQGNAPLVELFLRRGADPALASKDGDTPVELALRFGHAEVADILRRARQDQDARQGGAQPAPRTAG